MSRMFPWERWRTILMVYLCTGLLLLERGVGSVDTVPSTCGEEFFLPPLRMNRSLTSSVVGWLEVVACRDSALLPVPVTLTIYSTSGDVIHALSIPSNQTIRVELIPLYEKDRSIESRGLRLAITDPASVYAHSGESGTADVALLVPLPALSTSYLIPELFLSSDLQQQLAIVIYNVEPRTNITVTPALALIPHDEDARHTLTSGMTNSDGSNHAGSDGGRVVEDRDGDDGHDSGTDTLTVSLNTDSTTVAAERSATTEAEDERSEAVTSSSSTSASSKTTMTTTTVPTLTVNDANVTGGDVTVHLASSTRSSTENNNLHYSYGQDITKTTTTTTTTNNNNNNNNNNSINNTNKNKNNSPISIFFLSAALQSRTVFLSSGQVHLLRSDKPIGVVVLLRSFPSLTSSSTSSTMSPSSSSTTVSRSTSSTTSEGSGSGAGDGGNSNKRRYGGGCAGGDDHDDDARQTPGRREWITMEMLPPSSTFGKHFYLPLVGGISIVKLFVSGHETTRLEMQWTQSGGDFNASHHTLPALCTLALQPPITSHPRDGHVWLVSSAPVLVFAVIETSAAGGERDSNRFVNVFVLPAVEQYFVCTARKLGKSCHLDCPSFFNNGASCVGGGENGRQDTNAASNSSKVEYASRSASDNSMRNDINSKSDLRGDMINSSGGLSGENTSSNGGLRGNSITSQERRRNRQWIVVQHTVQRKSSNSTYVCVTANGSYLLYLLDPVSGSFRLAGARLQHTAYRMNSSSPSGDDVRARVSIADVGDAEDIGDVAKGYVIKGGGSLINDCEDEEAGLVVARSRGDLQKAVADAVLTWPFADYEEEESEMPLLAVIISLSVAIFAVIAVISTFLLMELMSRRRQIRNPKIRPFVS